MDTSYQLLQPSCYKLGAVKLNIKFFLFCLFFLVNAFIDVYIHPTVISGTLLSLENWTKKEAGRKKRVCLGVGGNLEGYKFSHHNHGNKTKQNTDQRQRQRCVKYCVCQREKWWASKKGGKNDLKEEKKGKVRGIHLSFYIIEPKVIIVRNDMNFPPALMKKPNF